jgi:flagellar motor switch protein FliM
MAEILSQQEIDSLLAGINSGSVSVAAPEVNTFASRSGKEAITFDFRLPHRLSKNQLRTLQAVHESFAETLSSFLISRLQTTVSISLASIDQLFYSEFVLSIGSPSCLYVFRIVESDALAVLELNPQLVLSIVSRMLGGPVGEEKNARLLTQIEQTIIRGITQRAVSDLQKAWKTIAPFTFQMERYETEGEFVQIAPASEIILLVSFEVTIGDQKFMMNICFPTFALEDELAKLNTQSVNAISMAQSKKGWSRVMAKKIEQTTLPVSVLLGSATLSVKELAELQVGDVIRTAIPVNGETAIEIGGATRFYGKAGVSNGKAAVKIERVNNNVH